MTPDRDAVNEKRKDQRFAAAVLVAVALILAFLAFWTGVIVGWFVWA